MKNRDRTDPKDGAASKSLRLRLYVAGDSPNSAAALTNLRAVIAEHPEQELSLDIVDVLEHPQRGLSDAVLVTPTLIRIEPLPERRVIGSLRDKAALLAALGLETLSP